MRISEKEKIALYKKYLKYCKKNNFNIYNTKNILNFKAHTKKIETIKSGLVEVIKVVTGVASAYAFTVLFLCL